MKPGCLQLAGVALMFLAGDGLAETLRVTRWDMANARAGKPESQIQEAAATLKELSPDVILLQHVRDWQMCGQLAEALKPANYSVVVCSSFRDPRTGASSKQQAAIISKRKAYFSWSEAWRSEGEVGSPGGFAFAAIQAGKQRIGFFSVQLDGPLSARAESGTNAAAGPALPTRQWLQVVAGFKSWVTNRLGAAVVAGGQQIQDGGAVALADTEVMTAFLGAPLSRPITLPAASRQRAEKAADLILASVTPNPERLPGVVLNHSPATCELEVTSSTPVAQQKGKRKQGAKVESRKQEQVEGGGETRPYQTASLLAAGGAVSNVVGGGEPGKLPSQAQTQRPVPAQEEAAVKEEAATTAAHAQEDRGAGRATPKVQSSEVEVRRPGLKSQVSVFHFPFPRWMAAVGGLTGLTLVGAILAGRRRRRSRSKPALVTGSVLSSYTVVVAPRGASGSVTENATASARPSSTFHIEAPGTQTQSETWPQRPWPTEQRVREATLSHPGLILHLSQWLKQKLVQKLIVDRASLLETQKEATLQLVTVDERLAKLEQQIQQQNQTNEQRIAELSRELLAAKEENRELIRARILQVKAEMEAARARIMAEGRKQ